MPNSRLQVAPRTLLGKKVAQMRRAGRTPGNIYGHKVDSKAVEADSATLLHLLRASSRNQIIDLSVEGEESPRTVVVRAVQRNPVNGRLLHIDFFQISMTEKMRAQVPLILIGTSPAVGTYGGILLQAIEHVDVEALPGDIPPHYEVDVSGLTELEQGIHVRDLNIDEEKVLLMTDPDVVVARVATPRLAAEDEEKPAVEGEEGEAAAPAEGEAVPSEETPAEESA